MLLFVQVLRVICPFNPNAVGDMRLVVVDVVIHSLSTKTVDKAKQIHMVLDYQNSDLGYKI